MISFIKKHKKISLIAILILAAGGYYFFKPNTASQTQTVYTYGAVETGAIMQTVSGTGQILPARETVLKSKISGKVLAVKVSAGQAVKSGDVIAYLDDRDAQAAVGEAQLALENARISLEELYEPADELALTQAKNALDQAQESLENDQKNLETSYKDGFDAVVSAFGDLPSIIAGMQDIVAGSSAYVVQSNAGYLDYYSNTIKDYDSQASQMAVAASSSFRSAKARYDKNFADYKTVSRSAAKEDIEALIGQTRETANMIAEALKNTAILIQRYKDVSNDQNLTVQSFADTHLTALADYAAKNNSHLNGLASAKSNIDDAQNSIVNDERTIDEKAQSLAKLTAAPEEIDVKSQKLVVQQKERALADAIAALNDCAITAPFDGVVAAVEIVDGDDVSANTEVATVITDNQIATITLNEVDIAKVQTGQKATLTFSAIDDFTITGKVVEVGLLGSVDQGVVNYEVKIALDDKNERIKSGMSVAAAIITAMKTDVTLAPSTAVKTADDGSAYVLVASDLPDQPRRQTVEIGLSDDTNTEIIQGVNAGDRVVISANKGSASKSSAKNSGPNQNGSMINFGGMGGR